MTMRRLLLLSGAPLVLAALLWEPLRCFAEAKDTRIFRLAELEIDAAQLESYKAALREEIATSIRVEPSVLMLYAVALKDDPTHIRLFEVYADAAAYEGHRETPHFKKYKTATAGMVKSLKLLEADAVMLGAKAR